VLVLVLADPWRPRLALDRAEARQLVRFALPVMGTHLAKFAGKKLDLALLGLFVSATDLGHYFLATRLIFALGLATHYTVYSLTLPVLARLASEPAALRSAAGRTLWLTTALCLPAGLGLALVADPLVPLLMGAVWQPSVPPLQILAGFSIAYALALVAGQIMVAAGSPGLFLRLTLANTALFLVMVAIAAPWGLVAAALAGSLANLLMLPTYLIALQRTVGLSPMAVLRDQLPVWLAVGLMALAVLAVRAAVGEALDPLPLLALVILAGLTAYALALWLLAGSTLRSLARTMSTDRGPPLHATSGMA
jgi:lipopolysaccharide exporter